MLHHYSTSQEKVKRGNSMINLLWQSTSALHERFGNTEKSIAHFRARWRKVEEEHQEFQYAPDNANLVEEAVDVLVTMMGVLQLEGVTLEELEGAVAKVIAKNGAKTQETHKLEDYQIVRRK